MLPAVAFAQQFSTEMTDHRPRLMEPSSEDVDEVDTRNGDLTIHHRDLVLPGNGNMDIVVDRVYSLSRLSAGLSSTKTQSYLWTALGPGWTIRAAPRIVQENNYYNDQTNGITYTDSPFGQLCSNRTFFNYGANLPVLELPDGTRFELFSSGGYRAVTKTNWKVECISGVVKAYSPDGVVFEFGDVHVGKYAVNEVQSATPPPQFPTRSVLYMDAVKATDANGNWIAYTYQAFGTPIEPWYGPLSWEGPDVSWTIAEYNESPSFLLSQITSSDGRSVTFTYDSQTGRLTSMSDDAGRTWSYSYLTPDAYNARVLSQVTLPTGISWKYSYAPGEFLTSTDNFTISPLNNGTITARKLTRLTYPTGGYIDYEYGFCNLSQSVGSGGSSTLLYARGERLTKRTLSTGESWTYSYVRGGAGQYDTTTVIGPEGTTTYKYMGPGYAISTQTGYPPAQYQNNAWLVGRLMQKTDPTGSQETYTYQAREILPVYTRLLELGFVHDQKVWAADLSQRTIVRDGSTYTTTYSNYDAYGNPGTKVESGPNGGSRTTTYTYLVDTTKWILNRVKDETRAGSSLLRTFDANANVLSLTDDGVTTSYTYDSQGNIATALFPRQLQHTYSSYKRGIPQTETQPEGISLSRVVDNAGQITSETDGEGHTKSYTYDGLGRVTSITPARGNSTSIVYTANTKTATRGSLVEASIFDGFGRPTSITLGGVNTTYVYDYWGRKTFESNPAATIGTSIQYDALNRVTRVTNADTSYQTYTYSPARVAIVDERSM